MNRTIILLLVALNVFLAYQYYNAITCANKWAGMYWDEEMTNIKLEQELRDYKAIDRPLTEGESYEQNAL
jgi:hypothetical protein